MGDPVTMAVVGGTIGAATNRKDPLKGALMGAAGGYAGGSLMGAGSTSPFSIGSFMNGIGTNFAAGGDPLKGAAMNAAAYSGSGASGFPINPEIGSNAILGSETLGGAWKDITAANTWMNQNPTTSRIGMELAKSLLSPEEQRMQSVGASTRQGGQIQPVDYMSLLNPQQQTVLRPATPSLI